MKSKDKHAEIDSRERADLFIDWYRWSLEHNDVDPAVYMMNYLFKRYEFNIEQRLWLCWLYGTTYHLPTAWVIWNEFPDYNLVGMRRLYEWNDANYHRLRYQTDTKYNKGHLPVMFESYREWIGGPDQYKKFQTFQRSFDDAWTEVNKLYKFGRYSSWFYLQVIHSCCGLKHIHPTDLKLKDHAGSRSHRNGLCYALGLDRLIDEKLHETKVVQLEQAAREILKRVRTTSVQPDYYTLETALCSFKKLFREKDGRYLGYYLDRQAEEINKVQNDGWTGVDWSVLWQARQETLHPRLAASRRIKKERFGEFLKTGRIRKPC